jgi:hypothetical protein
MREFEKAVPLLPPIFLLKWRINNHHTIAIRTDFINQQWSKLLMHWVKWISDVQRSMQQHKSRGCGSTSSLLVYGLRNQQGRCHCGKWLSDSNWQFYISNLLCARSFLANLKLPYYSSKNFVFEKKRFLNVRVFIQGSIFNIWVGSSSWPYPSWQSWLMCCNEYYFIYWFLASSSWCNSCGGLRIPGIKCVVSKVVLFVTILY